MRDVHSERFGRFAVAEPLDAYERHRFALLLGQFAHRAPDLAGFQFGMYFGDAVLLLWAT